MLFEPLETTMVMPSASAKRGPKGAVKAKCKRRITRNREKELIFKLEESSGLPSINKSYKLWNGRRIALLFETLPESFKVEHNIDYWASMLTPLRLRSHQLQPFHKCQQNFSNKIIHIYLKKVIVREGAFLIFLLLLCIVIIIIF
jgi:hypothetical protein